MRWWRRAVGLGVLAWLIPFVVAFLSFPARQAARPLFESIMAVTVAATAVALGLAFLRRCERDFVRQGILVGLLWLAMSVLIDAPLMLFGGPMQMSFGAYLADIGVTYLTIPVVTCGLGVARSWGAGRAPGAGV